jgi:YVTN family beta-propeller protein
MPHRACVFLAALTIAACAGTRDPAAPPPADAVAWPGAQADGSTLLPNGWRLLPHGRQIPLEADLPVRLAWQPGGRLLAVQHAGFRGHEVALVDTATDKVVRRIPLAHSWSGMAWSRDGERLFVSGGVDDVVRVLSVDANGAERAPESSWSVARKGAIALPAGMCVDEKDRLLVALQRANRVVRLDSSGHADLDVELPPDAIPFECAERGGRVFVSLWARAEVWVLDAETGARTAAIATGQHPSELLLSPDGERLFVSEGNENTVGVIGVDEARVEETISSALFPSAPPGSTPDSLAISPDGRTLYVANADNNDVAVVDVGERGASRCLGFVPVGCYPTSVRVSPDGTKVFVADGKGATGSHANPRGPRPSDTRLDEDQYTGSMFKGALTVFAPPDAAKLRDLTARTYRCAPLDAGAGVRAAARPRGSPIPARPGELSPIRYCVYVIKENRTYDQVLGDDPRGNGDPSLCLFGAEVTPNHHAIAQEFVLLDNFYVDAEVSADGHEWSMGAYATDFVERTWPVEYGGKAHVADANGRTVSLGYPSEGGDALATAKNGHVWDLARAAGIGYRSYGEFVVNGATPERPATTTVPALQGHFDPMYRSFDLGYADVRRAERFLAELAEFERTGDLPRLIVLRLPSDHTDGVCPGRPTPRAYLADNDLAFGMVLEGLSRSRFWPQMAVFSVEDDAQNGPDHVDAHRSIAFVAGPWVKRGAVVSTMYSTASVLRTIELILGLPPMSQFDAAATPMYACFADVPDPAPYVRRAARWQVGETNAADAWGAERSAAFDTSREDAADDVAFNEVIWRSVKGADSPMPPPRRAAFVRVAGD